MKDGVPDAAMPAPRDCLNREYMTVAEASRETALPRMKRTWEAESHEACSLSMVEAASGFMKSTRKVSQSLLLAKERPSSDFLPTCDAGAGKRELHGGAEGRAGVLRVVGGKKRG